MDDLPPGLLAAITGFIAGTVLSIPVGPVNLTIINEGSKRGFWWAALIGLGAVTMEVIYCALAFTGFASIFGGRLVKAAMELCSFVFMLYLGVRFLLTREVAMVSRVEEQLEHRLHPHSAFMIGFVRVLGNPAVLLFWIILAANFISREWVQPTLTGKLACVGGVAVGTGLWFLGLSYAVSLGHRKLSPRTLLRMQHVSGMILLLLALIHGGHIVWQMARHAR